MTDEATSLAWQAMSYGDPSKVLRLHQVAVPDPDPGVVVIEVAAAGVSLPDVIMVGGTYQIRPTPPFTPGREVVGTVVKVDGSDRQLLRRRVVARPLLPHGGYAQHTRARSVDLFAIDEAIPDRDAATLLVTYLTAHVALHRRARVQPGETVLVLGGAGGVGSAAVQLAKAAGATVLTTASGRERTAACRQLGADHVIDRLSDVLGEVITEVTDGRGVDVIIDPVGGELFEQARKHLAWEGRAVLVGFASGSQPQVRANAILLRNQSLLGLHLGPYQDHAPHVTNAAFADLLDLHRRGSFTPLISTTFSFSDVPQALAAVASGTVIGKLVVDVAPSSTQK